MYTCKAGGSQSHTFYCIRPDGRLVPLHPPYKAPKDNKAARQARRSHGHVRADRLSKYFRWREEVNWGWDPVVRLWRIPSDGDPFIRYEGRHPPTAETSNSSTVLGSTQSPKVTVPSPAPTFPSREQQRTAVMRRHTLSRPADRVEDVAGGYLVGRNPDQRTLLLKVGNWSPPGPSPLRDGMESMCVDVGKAEEATDEIAARVASLSLQGRGRSVVSSMSNKSTTSSSFGEQVPPKLERLPDILGPLPLVPTPATASPPLPTAKRRTHSPSKCARKSGSPNKKAEDYPPPAPNRSLRRSTPLPYTKPEAISPWPWRCQPRPLVALTALSSLAASPPFMIKKKPAPIESYPPQCAAAVGSWKRCAVHSTAQGSPKHKLAQLLLLHWPFGVGAREVQRSLCPGSALAPASKRVIWTSSLAEEPNVTFNFGRRPRKEQPNLEVLSNRLARVPPPQSHSDDYSPCSAGLGPIHDFSVLAAGRRFATQPTATGDGNVGVSVSITPVLEAAGARAKRARSDKGDGNTTPPKSPRIGSGAKLPESATEAEQRLLSILSALNKDDEDDDSNAMDVDSMPSLTRSASPAPSPLPTPRSSPNAIIRRPLEAHPINVLRDEVELLHASLDETKKHIEATLKRWRSSTV